MSNKKARPGHDSGAGSTGDRLGRGSDAENTRRGLRQRRAASWRTPPILCSGGVWRRDPWHDDPVPVTGSPFGLTPRETAAEAARLLVRERWHVYDVIAVLRLDPITLVAPS